MFLKKMLFVQRLIFLKRISHENFEKKISNKKTKYKLCYSNLTPLWCIEILNISHELDQVPAFHVIIRLHISGKPIPLAAPSPVPICRCDKGLEATNFHAKSTCGECVHIDSLFYYYMQLITLALNFI